MLSDLALRSKALWGYDTGFLEACRAELTLTPDAVRADPVYVAEEGGRVLGLYRLEAVAGDEAELGLLYVEPDSAGRGLGTLLLEHAVESARALGCRRLLIQADPNAEPFYRARGAVRCGTRPSGSIPGRELPLLCLDV